MYNAGGMLLLWGPDFREIFYGGFPRNYPFPFPFYGTCVLLIKPLYMSVSKNACADGAECGGTEYIHASSIQ